MPNINTTYSNIIFENRTESTSINAFIWQLNVKTFYYDSSHAPAKRRLRQTPP
jgi:hypothetical protein